MTDFKKTTDIKKALKIGKAERILQILNDTEDLNGSSFAYDDYDSEELGLGKVKEVFHQREGTDHDLMVVVKHFVDYDVYIQVTGYYDSHSGTDFEDDFTEVTPKTKTVTYYETV